MRPNILINNKLFQKVKNSTIMRPSLNKPY